MMERLKEAQLKLKPVKCQFIHKEVDYLGRVLTPKGLKVNSRLVEAVTNFPQSQNVLKCVVSWGWHHITGSLFPSSLRLLNHCVP